MGLIYQLPISEEEKDFLVLNEDSLILKSYGLPPIFWLYLLAGLIFFSFLLLGAWGPVKTMISQGGLNSSLAWSLIVFLALIPMISLSFFFYEYRVVLKKQSLTLEHRVFWIPIKRSSRSFENLYLDIQGHMDSPNMARIKNIEGERAFQNKGYFILRMDEKFVVDRSSSKADLNKIKNLLLHYSEKL